MYLMVGLPGSGKTTRAKELEKTHPAIRFNADEWIVELYEHVDDGSNRVIIRDKVEQLQWRLTKKLLKLGKSVILDWGFWSASEREKYAEEAHSLRADVKIEFLDAPINELWKRASRRIETQELGFLHFTKQDLEGWANIFEPPTEHKQNNHTK